ncbi:MAG TPA: hypothetical protein ENK67_05330 [Flavobacteriia bacterium]|nr:hypothetical protein [Flavobacteriia bacterium]
MILKKLFIFVFLLFSFSCISGQKNETKQKKKTVSPINTNKKHKQKVGNNTVSKAVKKTFKFANNLDFNLDEIQNKGLPDKKYLAEYLGLFLKVKKFYHRPETDEQIKLKLKPIVYEIEQKKFHNMAAINDKLFKKNSMSYMRIMWLLQQLGYDIKNYKQEFLKIKNRMDDHMKLRGEWQRAVFDKYYDYFKLSKPIELKYAKKLKGPIAYQKTLEFYNRENAYILTHFIFTAFDYGNSLTQNRFDATDLKYLNDILPKITAKFELKNNDDIVGELLTCQVLLNNSNTPEFKQSFTRLLSRQNHDGSFGAYEKYRKKIGKDIEYRAYLHTTLVAIEPFIEYDFRKNKRIKD